jgi:hypothetical protein
MYYEFIQKHKRQAVIIFVAIIALITLAMTATYAGRAGKTAVVISTVPSDAQITFSDQNESNGTQWLKDGTYKVVAKKDGFDTLTRTVIVSKDKSQNVVAVSLTAKSADAKKWAADHDNDYRRNEQYGAIEASSNGQYFTSLNPITAKLPFQDPYFTIGYTQNNDQTISLTITTPSPRYRFYAVEKIRQLGYDPTDFKITFNDFLNPLGTGVKR